MAQTRTLMTQAEFAARRGVRPSAVSNYKSKGLLVFGEDDAGRTLVDVERTEARLNAKIDPTRGRPKSDAPTASPPTLPLAPAAPDQLGEVRTDLLREQRVGQRLKNAKESGSLVALAEYERRSHELGRLARERMHSIVRTLSERLAAEREPRNVVALLSGEIDRVFGELADTMDAAAAAEVEDDAAGAAAEAALEAEVESEAD